MLVGESWGKVRAGPQVGERQGSSERILEERKPLVVGRGAVSKSQQPFERRPL